MADDVGAACFGFVGQFGGGDDDGSAGFGFGGLRRSRDEREDKRQQRRRPIGSFGHWKILPGNSLDPRRRHSFERNAHLIVTPAKAGVSTMRQDAKGRSRPAPG